MVMAENHYLQGILHFDSIYSDRRTEKVLEYHNQHST